MSEPPHTIGRYEVLGEIGRGGMAVVYRSRHFELERIDALKALHGVTDGGPDTASRFLHEARVASALSHPNIVTVYDYFEWCGTPYIAMEFLDRGSLRPYVRDLTFAQIGGVLGDVLAGLAHAERRRVVHRDLKPENLLVTDEGRVKIADFGIAKATSRVGAAAFRTATGVTVGTPGYMAPEQAMAQNVGPWTDLYSVGCMAYEMCVGQLPFSDSDGPIALLLRHVNEPIQPALSVNPHMNADFSGWIDNLLVKEPERRTASPTIAWEMLEEILITTIGPRWRRAAALPDAVPTRGDRGEALHPLRSSILPNDEIAVHLGSRRAVIGEKHLSLPGPWQHTGPDPSGEDRTPPLEAAAEAPHRTEGAPDGRADAPAEAEGQSAGRADHGAASHALDPAATVAPRDDATRRRPTGLSAPGSPPSRDQRAAGPRRARRAVLIAGCALVVLIVAGAVLALTPRGGSHDRQGGQPAQIARAVRELASILDFSAAGNHLSKQGDFSGALQNRTEVASRLAGFHPPQALRAAAATLTQVADLAIQYNRKRLSGQDDSARTVDREANALRHRFLAQFNAFAQRYLGRSYHIGEF